MLTALAHVHHWLPWLWAKTHTPGEGDHWQCHHSSQLQLLLTKQQELMFQSAHQNTLLVSA
jgi:hypothetical protein